MRAALLVLLLCGCRQVFGLDSPQRLDATRYNEDAARDDAALEDATPIDAMVDAPRVCPAAPLGCTLFTCTGASSSCYYECPDRSWSAANSFCVSESLGCLVTINSTAEQQCVTTATSPNFPDVVFTGWVQASGSTEPAGGWGWTCGTSSFIAPNWGGVEPNNFDGGENCGAMTAGGGWIDATCATTTRFVCELP
jgi:Lectin C-type domain